MGEANEASEEAQRAPRGLQKKARECDSEDDTAKLTLQRIGEIY